MALKINIELINKASMQETKSLALDMLIDK